MAAVESCEIVVIEAQKRERENSEYTVWLLKMSVDFRAEVTLEACTLHALFSHLLGIIWSA